ncbi:MAG: triphosphoribosyl-dephospho-CoA synthase [Gemmataceae bacterium]|nr:triphosphoribosyl-dephospho-CoA synthase [Gemmataceae bacterium]
MTEYEPAKIAIDYDRDAEVACIWEVAARKMGNVHPRAEYRDLGLVDFLLSAAAIRSTFRLVGHSSLGWNVLLAVRQTRTAVGSNTNLGMILLLTPLVDACLRPGSLREATSEVLSGLTVRDTEHVYRAIRLANPGGLGDAPEQDVRAEPTLTLLDAMKLAADRDMVARQYSNGFADVFDFGVPAFLDALGRFGCVEAAVIDSQLRWLAEYPDSLIARKNGPAAAEEVRRRAADLLRLGGIATPEGRRAGVALDKYLRSDGNKLNPGTTADLITACLFVALREGKVAPSAPFRWPAEDWL